MVFESIPVSWQQVGRWADVQDHHEVEGSSEQQDQVEVIQEWVWQWVVHWVRYHLPTQKLILLWDWNSEQCLPLEWMAVLFVLCFAMYFDQCALVISKPRAVRMEMRTTDHLVLPSVP
jgi:hypothetical protein